MKEDTGFDQAEIVGLDSARNRSPAARSAGTLMWLVLKHPFCALFLLLANPAQTQAQWSEPDPRRESIQMVDRAFGLQLGDLVTRSVRIRGKAAEFSRDELPEPGPVSAWVYLLSTEIDEHTDQVGNATWLTLTYQITGAAPAVTLVDLPALKLLGPSGEESPVLARLDAVPVSVSPIMGERPFQRLGMGDLQSDALVPITPRSFWQKMMWTMAALAILLTALLLSRLWWRHRPDQQTPFVQASVSLKSESTLGSAYQLLHRAFDRTAQQSMMLDDVPAFIESNPAYRKVLSEIDGFFEASRDQFFRLSDTADINEMPGSDETEIRKLRTVAKKLARIEQELL